jgi:hypothetical protein
LGWFYFIFKHLEEALRRHRDHPKIKLLSGLYLERTSLFEVCPTILLANPDAMVFLTSVLISML